MTGVVSLTLFRKTYGFSSILGLEALLIQAIQSNLYEFLASLHKKKLVNKTFHLSFTLAFCHSVAISLSAPVHWSPLHHQSITSTPKINSFVPTSIKSCLRLLGCAILLSTTLLIFTLTLVIMSRAAFGWPLKQVWFIVS